MKKVNLREELSQIKEHWTPKLIGEINDTCVKAVKMKGEFLCHKHDNEDELFLVIQGELQIRLREDTIYLKEGEFFVVPKGIEHQPYAAAEVYALLFEPKTTIKEGD